MQFYASFVLIAATSYCPLTPNNDFQALHYIHTQLQTRQLQQLQWNHYPHHAIFLLNKIPPNFLYILIKHHKQQQYYQNQLLQAILQKRSLNRIIHVILYHRLMESMGYILICLFAVVIYEFNCISYILKYIQTNFHESGQMLLHASLIQCIFMITEKLIPTDSPSKVQVLFHELLMQQSRRLPYYLNIQLDYDVQYGLLILMFLLNHRLVRVYQIPIQYKPTSQLLHILPHDHYKGFYSSYHRFYLKSQYFSCKCFQVHVQPFQSLIFYRLQPFILRLNLYLEDFSSVQAMLQQQQYAQLYHQNISMTYQFLMLMVLFRWQSPSLISEESHHWLKITISRFYNPQRHRPLIISCRLRIFIICCFSLHFLMLPLDLSSCFVYQFFVQQIAIFIILEFKI